jgi:cyclase
VIDVARGGSIQGEIDALNRLVELAIPSIPLVSQEGGTYVIPGHGRVCDQLDVVDYRDMITIIRDRIQSLIQDGRTLDQIKAASPTQGYTPRYGSDSGPWTTSMFVEAVYQSLTQGKRE